MKLPIIKFPNRNVLAILAETDHNSALLNLHTGEINFINTSDIYSKGTISGTVDLPNFTGTIYLDVDDILVNFHEFFNRFLSQKYKLKVPANFKPLRYDYEDVLYVINKTADQIFHDMGINWPRHLSPIENASLFTKSLKALGARIVLITSITAQQIAYRMENLADLNIVFDEIHPSKGTKKSAIINLLSHQTTKYDLFIDDMILNCFDVAINTYGPTILTLYTPYNETFVIANSQLAYAAMRSKIQSFNNVNDIFINALEHVSSAILKMKGLKSYEPKEDISINIKDNP